MNYYTEVLKKYAVFMGRASRKEYWMFVLWNVIISIVLSIVLAILASITNVSMINSLVYLYTLAILIPSVAVLARRLHDTNRSAWWLLIAFIPIIGVIVLIIFAVMDTTPGDNQYGPNPKGASPTIASAS